MSSISSVLYQRKWENNMSKFQPCEHIKGMGFNVMIQAISWEKDGIYHNACVKCYRSLINSETDREQNQIVEKQKRDEKYK